MAADLHIHIRTPEVTDKVWDVWAHEHTLDFVLSGNRPSVQPTWDECFDLIAATPNIWIGEVSWLKASLFDASEEFIPNLIQAVHDMFKEADTQITDDLIEEVRSAFDLSNQTDYRVTERDKAIEFLTQYKGERAFTVSW